jgi:hypothetical protein
MVCCVRFRYAKRAKLRDDRPVSRSLIKRERGRWTNQAKDTANEPAIRAALPRCSGPAALPCFTETLALAAATAAEPENAGGAADVVGTTDEEAVGSRAFPCAVDAGSNVE